MHDFADAFFPITTPTGPDVLALEMWGCSDCHQVQWARLTFQRLDPVHYRFDGAETVHVDASTASRVHFLSRMVDTWLDRNADPAARSVLAAYGHLVPWIAREGT